MGTLLQEIIRQPGAIERNSVKRTDLLSYSRLEGRWGYVSFDTRAPVGLMPAWSAGRGDASSISIVFEPFAVPTSGNQSPFLKSGDEAAAGTIAKDQLVGQFIQMDQIIRFDGPNNDVKDQYFTLSDGTGTRWLAHRYAYVRHPSRPATAH